MFAPNRCLRERAVAVLEGKPPLVRVIALNEKARLLGMETGMTKLQAEVLCDKPNVGPAKAAIPQSGIYNASSARSAILRQRSPEQENAAHAALLDVAHAFSPRVEDAAPDTCCSILRLGTTVWRAGKDGQRTEIA